MNLTRVFNGNYDDLDENDIIIGLNSDIYKKNKTLESEELYILSRKDNNLKWEFLSKIHENALIPYGSLIENVNHLSYTIEESLLENGDKYNYLMMYKVNELGTLTHTMIISNMNPYAIFEWRPLSSDLNIHLVNKYVTSKPMKDIPIHIDLTKASEDDYILPFDPYDIINDESLDGWNTNAFVNHEDSIKDIKLEDLDHSEDITIEDSIKIEDSEDIIDKYEEQRIDPYDNEWYTKSEFYDYYGGYTEWDFQDPKKLLIREKIMEFAEIFANQNPKKFIFLYKQYEKTF